MVEELTNNGLHGFVKEGLTVIDFFAEWCMPCIMLSPVIDELSEKLDKVKFAKVNIDDSKELAEKFSVMSVPTLIVFKDGEEVDRIVGALPAEQLEEKITSHVE